MTNFLKTFLADESGASAAEYALILAVVGVAIGGASIYLAGTIKTAIQGAGDRVSACSQAAATGAAATVGSANCDTSGPGAAAGG